MVNRYIFHIQTDGVTEVVEAPHTSRRRARAAALRLAGENLQDMARTGDYPLRWAVKVRDEHNQDVFSVVVALSDNKASGREPGKS